MIFCNIFIQKIKGWLSIPGFWEGPISFKIIFYQTWAWHKVFTLRGGEDMRTSESSRRTVYTLSPMSELSRYPTAYGLSSSPWMDDLLLKAHEDWGLLLGIGEKISSLDQKLARLTSRYLRKCIFPVRFHIMSTFIGFGIDNRRKIFLK